MSQPYDLIVIGAGPAGYVAAIRAAQLGLSVVCIDEMDDPSGRVTNGKASIEPTLGGTCLNVGCIPSKALLDSSEQFHRLTHQFAQHGIECDNPRMDVATMQARKEKIVKQLTGGIRTLFKTNKVTAVYGHGRIRSSTKVDVLEPGTETVTETLSGEHILIATGSTPIAIGSMAFDGSSIVDSTGALDFTEVPQRLGIIGAGVIGLELGSVWRRLGAEVVILEATDSFLPTCDAQIARDAKNQFKKQGLDIRLGCRVESAKVVNGQVDVTYQHAQDTATEHFDKLIVAVGRRPNTDHLFGNDVNVTLNERGFIEVDQEGRTSIPGVWAVGDVTPGPMLAHKASEEGIAVVERIVNGIGHVNYETIPWVIYTNPEIAWVGLTEGEAKEKGLTTATGMFPFAATGRAKAMEDTAGFVKIVADAKTDRILGVHMIGPHVSELLAEAVLAMEYGASSEDLARTVHAHPTLSEAVHEAALAVDKRAIHKVN